MVFPVKWYDERMEGAPLLSTGSWYSESHVVAPGNLIALLKAVLVTGFGARQAASVTYDQNTNKITVDFGSSHKYQKYQIVALSGAGELAFTGEFRVLSVTTNTIVLAPDNGAPSVSAASGTVTVKIPPLGWEVYLEDQAAFKAIFRRKDASATPIMMYVDNSAFAGWSGKYAHVARVGMISDVIDINTYTTEFMWTWPASHNYSAPGWSIIGDSLMMYFLCNYSVARALCRGFFMFGDIKTVRPGDRYHCLFGFYPQSDANGAYWYGNNTVYPSNMRTGDGSHLRIAREYHQAYGEAGASLYKVYNSYGEGTEFPNRADNGLYVSTAETIVNGTGGLRGTLPGVVNPLFTRRSFDRKVLDNLPNIPGGLTLLLIASSSSYSDTNTDYGRLIGFDIKGPWR